MLGKFAKVVGSGLVVAGILGFMPELLTDGKLLGYFPVNFAHNAVHLLLGMWGLTVAKHDGWVVTYAKSLAVIYGLLAVFGLIPATNTLFRLAPIGGMDVGLHAVLAVVAAWFGFGTPARSVGAKPATAPLT